jgi:hypothetical protein
MLLETAEAFGEALRTLEDLHLVGVIEGDGLATGKPFRGR